MASIFVTNRQSASLVARLDVSEAVAGRLIVAGLYTVKRARAASVDQLTAIEGIDSSKAAEIRGGGQ